MKRTMADPTDRTIRLEIGGMTCASCVRAVEKSVENLPGVEAVAVNLATGDAQISWAGTAGEGATSNPVTGLVEAIEHAGYRARVTSEEELPTDTLGEEEIGSSRRRFLHALAGTTPAAIAMWGLSPSPLSWTIQGVAAAWVLFFPGRLYFRVSWDALRRGHTTMDTLIALGAGTAFLASIAASTGALGEGAPIYFETAAFLITFISLGKWLEARARGEARAALRSLLDLTPPTARRLVNGDEETVEVAQLQVGDRVVVLPGERVPADGVVRAGTTTVDESLLTGEAIPVEKTAWDDVTGGTVNGVGRIEVELTATGGKTVLAGIVRMVREAQAQPAPIQRLADRVSAVFVPLVLLLALITFGVWMFTSGDVSTALRFAVSVVVIACPCALGLATPTAILVGSGLGLRHGILIKSGRALEALARADRMFLDKTGTITEGRFQLASVDVAVGDEESLIGFAAALERGSTHPLARAIVELAEARGVALPPLESVEETHGLGLAGVVGGKTVRLGRPEFLRKNGVELPEEVPAETSRVLVAIDGVYAGSLSFTDTPRAEAAEVCETLRNDRLTPVLLTGDRQGAAEKIAAEVGIETVIAEVPPGEKQAVIARAQEEGAVVAMVGDGLNDAPALARADVGLAIGAGADAAKESGGMVLVRSDLRDLLAARRLARATMKKVRSNLVWAFLYNLIGLPVAAGAFASMGVVLRPEFAGLAMALSSVSVVTNSLLLRRSEARIFFER